MIQEREGAGSQRSFPKRIQGSFREGTGSLEALLPLKGPGPVSRLPDQPTYRAFPGPYGAPVACRLESSRPSGVRPRSRLRASAGLAPDFPFNPPSRAPGALKQGTLSANTRSREKVKSQIPSPGRPLVYNGRHVKEA